MRTDLTCPTLGDVGTITLTKWLKREGDQVTTDEPVVEISTDKAVMDVPAPADGRLFWLAVAEGSTIYPHQYLAAIYS